MMWWDLNVTQDADDEEAQVEALQQEALRQEANQQELTHEDDLLRGRWAEAP